MSLKFEAPEDRSKKKDTLYYSLACNTCHDPESEDFPLIILYNANMVSGVKEVKRFADDHEKQFGKAGKRHKLVAQGEWRSVTVAIHKDWGGVPSAKELAPGHPGYQKQRAERARSCPIRRGN